MDMSMTTPMAINATNNHESHTDIDPFDWYFYFYDRAS